MPFTKGKSGNPNGRPKRPEVEELRQALKAVAEKKDKTFITSYTERAYTSDPMAIALLKKLVPDLTEGELGNNAREILMQIIDFGGVKK